MIRSTLCTSLFAIAAACCTSAAAFAGGDCCAKPAEAVAINAEGATCAKPAEAVAVNAEGATCAKAAEAVAVNATDAQCAAACEGEAQAVAVGNPAAKAMPVGVFAPVNAQCTGCAMPPKEGIATVVSGFTVGFCNDHCKDEFAKKPAAEQAAFVASQVKTTINTACPGSGMPVQAGKVALYEGFAVGFCCDDCLATWNKSDDAKKVAFIAKQHAAENANCPGSGNPINAEVVALYRGHTVGFCCEGCQGKFNAMSDEEKNTIVAGFALGAEKPASAEGCADCATGECDGSCKADA